jgi:MATE family multidrug resistance protein
VGSRRPAAPVIVALGAQLLIVAVFFQLADARRSWRWASCAGCRTRAIPMIYAVVSYWLVGMPAAYLLRLHAGLGRNGHLVGDGRWACAGGRASDLAVLVGACADDRRSAT